MWTDSWIGQKKKKKKQRSPAWDPTWAFRFPAELRCVLQWPDRFFIQYLKDYPQGTKSQGDLGPI